MKTNWTKEYFLERTGRLPENDDLDRVNCKDAGKLGHNDCGVCMHNYPMFMCPVCFGKTETD